MIKGLIFDLDGTLLDTIADLGNSVNKALSDFNCPTHSLEAYKLKVGHGFRNLIEVSAPENTDVQTIDKLLERFVYHYDKAYTENTVPYPGIVEVLEALQKMGIKLAVNSNKREDYTRNLIKLNFPNIEFVDVIGQRSDKAKKPDPWGAHEIAREMGLNFDEILYVGDSNTDMQTAKNAKMKSIGVDWGFRGSKELVETGASYIAYKTSDILDIIKK